MKTRILTLTGILMFIFSGAFALEGDTVKTTDTVVTMPFQFTFISPIGTNGLISSKTTHYLSLNAIAGYNGGVNGIEVGGFVNVLEYDMQGAQVAGFANVVRGEMSGIQVAGFSNYVHGKTDGIIVSGFSNHCNEDSRAIQVAGFSNQSLGKLTGAQVSGFSNVSLDTTMGAQLAGFVNYAGKKTTAVQAAGFANITKGEMTGPQFAGFANVSTNDVIGSQIAGFANYGRNVTGGQVSGFVNIAKNVTGTQIGFINVADSFAEGMPVGFISVVADGYRNYSFGVNELLWSEFQFKTGVERFYNIFSASINPFGPRPSWAFGYGVGSKVLNLTNSDVALEFVGYHVNEGEIFSNTYNALYRLNARYEYHPKAGRFGIWAGPSINLQQSAYHDVYGDDFKSKLAPYTVFEEKGTYIHSKMWIGAQVGVCF